MLGAWLYFDAETAREGKCADRPVNSQSSSQNANSGQFPVVGVPKELLREARTCGRHVAAAAAALHAVDDVQPPRRRAARGTAVAAHAAARRRLLRSAHAGRRAARPLLGGAARLLALRADERVEHSCPEACTTPCTLASASAGSGRPPSLGQPRPARWALSSQPERGRCSPPSGHDRAVLSTAHVHE